MFEDRKQAGQKLAEALNYYKNCNGIVLAIPRGGVEVGYYVAKSLELPLSIIAVRKLPFPENPESGFGAVAEDGSIFLVNRYIGIIPRDRVQIIIEKQKLELKRRIEVFREGKLLPAIEGKTIILVDDGIAMGSTMRAAVMLCRNKKAGKIIVASPVSGPDTAKAFEKAVDEVVILEKPPLFHAVAEAYGNWYDVPDNEVIKIMRKVTY